MSKITIRELHPSLVKLINSGGTGTSGSVFKHIKKTVHIDAPVSEVSIGIPEFDKDNDCLMVFKNSTYIEKDIDYSISPDGSTIIPIEGQWNTLSSNMVFNFILLKNVSTVEVIKTRMSNDVTVNESDWVLQEDGTYKITKIHNLNTDKPLVIAYDINGNSMSISVKRVNKTTVDIFSNIAVSCNITVINGGDNIIENVIDDNNVSDTTTFSSEKIKEEIDSLKQSGVNTKSGMKDAINSKVTVPDVSDSDNWDTYIQRVNDIKEGRGNAQVADVLAGKTFTNDSGELSTGSIPVVTPNIGDYVNSHYMTGEVQVGSYTNGVGNSVYFKVPSNTYYKDIHWISSQCIDLIPDNIKAGANILGVIGSMQDRKWASGTINHIPAIECQKINGSTGSTNCLEINNLSFKPSIICVYSRISGDLVDIGYLIRDIQIDTALPKSHIYTFVGSIKVGSYGDQLSSGYYHTDKHPLELPNNCYRIPCNYYGREYKWYAFG